MKLICKKKICLFLTLCLLIASLTGCSADTTLTIKEDLSGSSCIALTMSAKLWQLMEMDDLASTMNSASPSSGQTITVTDLTVNQVACKKLEITTLFPSLEAYNMTTGSTHLTMNQNYALMASTDSLISEDDASLLADSLKDYLEAVPDDETNPELAAELKKELQTMSMSSSICFPYPVLTTNGKIQSDGRTVVWKLDLGSSLIDPPSDSQTDSDQLSTMYATFRENQSTLPPVFQNVQEGGLYRKEVCLQVASENLPKQVSISASFLKQPYLSQSNEFYLTKTGTYHIVATDIAGNSSSISFQIDTIKPQVTGVKNNVTYKTSPVIRFTDKDSGIEKATLNGVLIHSGKKVVKAGNYLLKVYDRAGNVRIVKFKKKSQ